MVASSFLCYLATAAVAVGLPSSVLVGPAINQQWMRALPTTFGSDVRCIAYLNVVNLVWNERFSHHLDNTFHEMLLS